jgi:Fe-Mn family superoxide dismutase
MFEIPSLKYKYSDLEPYIDEETMRLHHTKHHQTYVDKLNVALEPYPDLAKQTIEELLRDVTKIPEVVRQAVINNGGGHYNHCRFWESINPNTGELREQTITTFEKAFINLTGFKEQFKTAALGHFGSGWVWVVVDASQLKIVTSANQNTPWSNGPSMGRASQIPILTLDLWEHAYYLKYQNRRADYVDAFFKIINWEQVEKNIANQQEML